MCGLAAPATTFLEHERGYGGAARARGEAERNGKREGRHHDQESASKGRRRPPPTSLNCAGQHGARSTVAGTDAHLASMRYASDMRPSASESKLHDGARWPRLLRNRFLQNRFWCSYKMFLLLLSAVGMGAPGLVIYQRRPTTRSEQHAERADTPSARIAGQADGRWMALHESFVKRAAAGGIELLFLGDSLTMQWLQHPAWRDEWEPRGAVNFGIGGDRIQHAHWRVEHGEIDIAPPPKASQLPRRPWPWP